ncbi:helix-turn-helix domain-containing protein [Enterococcus sp. HY326]|uniref:helix-turn-helix domain-containing protein n=1 Tax=Enterococcus sp. HY326 TaxID=2971265 RepID=UPI0022401CDC|nr:helix-turn-helix domain-containing protein [Enterococcus sp. HY326]
MDIGAKIKEQRLHHGLTQEQLAQHLNVSRSALSGWEVGRNLPDIASLIQLADLFQLSLDQLLREELKMKEFYVKDQPLNTSRDFEFMDSFGNAIYQVKEVSLLPTPKSYHLYQNQKKIGEISQRRFNFLPRFYIKMTGFKQVLIKKDIEAFRTSYQIQGESLSISPGWLTKNFDVMQAGRKVLTVSEGNPLWPNGYRIIILDLALEKLLIGFMAGILLMQNFERPYTEK